MPKTFGSLPRTEEAAAALLYRIVAAAHGHTITSREVMEILRAAGATRGALLWLIRGGHLKAVRSSLRLRVGTYRITERGLRSAVLPQLPVTRTLASLLDAATGLSAVIEDFARRDMEPGVREVLGLATADRTHLIQVLRDTAAMALQCADDLHHLHLVADQLKRNRQSAPAVRL